MHIEQVAKGEGKGWAKGRKASNDPRIARNAEARRGLRYLRHIPLEQDKRVRYHRASTIEWNARMSYAVGLAATDGCLYRDKRHINFTSEDEELVAHFPRSIGRDVHYRADITRAGGTVFRVDFSDVLLWRWLFAAGLTPAKSLTLGALRVPPEYLLECARGLMEGDGGIANFTHAATRKRYPNYRYERIIVAFNSASRSHLEWLRTELEPHAGGPGWLTVTQRKDRRNPMHSLRYGKTAGLRLLPLLYRDPSVPRLLRKWKIREGYRDRNCADGGT